MGKAVVALALLACLAGPAAADEPDDLPPPPVEMTMSYQLKERLTLYSGELGQHLNALSFNLVDFDFNAHTRHAKLRLGGELGSQLSLRIDGDVMFQRGIARVATRVDLAVVGRHLRFELPEFEMVPRTWAGERWVEVRLPLLEGRF